MSKSVLPERASLEYLRKLARDRLRVIRQTDSEAKLADALLSVAREYGFPSWRALKAELDRRRTTDVSLFFDACAQGDAATLTELLTADPDLVRATDPGSRYPGWTGLHVAAQNGREDAVRVLLEHGADPDARESGDNTYPLHWSAARRDVGIIRALLDAGGDVHGTGDDHALDVIGWATYFHPTADQQPGGTLDEVLDLLISRGARHHIYSAISLGDMDVIRDLVEHDPSSLDRRMSRNEGGMTPLHFAIRRGRYDIVDLLVELGVDVEAVDGHGHTALATAMLEGNDVATRRLVAAGSTPPPSLDTGDFRARMAELAKSVRRAMPSITVTDIAASLDWYVSIGFSEVGRHADDGLVNWGMVSFGEATLAFGMQHPSEATVGQSRHRRDASLWFDTNRIESLYELLRARQLSIAGESLASEATRYHGIVFEEHLYRPFYGGRQFSIRDPDGYALIFLQQDDT